MGFKQRLEKFEERYRAKRNLREAKKLQSLKAKDLREKARSQRAAQIERYRSEIRAAKKVRADIRAARRKRITSAIKKDYAYGKRVYKSIKPRRSGVYVRRRYAKPKRTYRKSYRRTYRRTYRRRQPSGNYWA